jgi:hypothetical protein
LPGRPGPFGPFGNRAGRRRWRQSYWVTLNLESFRIMSKSAFLSLQLQSCRLCRAKYFKTTCWLDVWEKDDTCVWPIGDINRSPGGSWSNPPWNSPKWISLSKKNWYPRPHSTNGHGLG